MSAKQTTDYTFTTCILKPNSHGEINNIFKFYENIYDILNYSPIPNIPIEYTQYIERLTNYLKSRDYISYQNYNFDTFLFNIEHLINPTKLTDKSFVSKTCSNNDDYLIMYIYDETMKEIIQFNHLATILNSTIDPVCGPVIITKINKHTMRHEDILIEDIVKLWFSTKQVLTWHFNKNKWTLTYIYNNNKKYDYLLNFKFIIIKTSLIFYKTNIIKTEDEYTTYLIENINNIDKLSILFDELYICKIRMGEYLDMTTKYNDDLIYTHDIILDTIKNAFNDKTSDIVVESIFQDVNNKLILLN